MQHSRYLGALALILGAVCALTSPAGAAQRTGLATWQQVTGPVLKPTLKWEGKSVQEPTVLHEGGRYRLWYSGGWHHQRLGYAESRDGIHWAKRSTPVMWNSQHASVVKTRTGYMIFSATSDDDLTQAFSPDGIHITSRRVIFRPKAGWTQQGFANSYAFRSGDHWKLMYEALGDKGLWLTGLATGGPDHWTGAPHPLRLSYPGGMAGGVWRDGRCLYFHGTKRGIAPTLMYRRCGPDLHHLGPIQFVFGLQQPWQVDQVADPSIARAPGKPPLMLFSGVNNPAESGMIGAAWLLPVTRRR